jgi:hypothetical protein
MEYIQFSLIILLVVFIYIVITGIFMKVANYIGEVLGFRKFIEILLRKITKK